MRRKMTRASWGIAPKESPRDLRTKQLAEIQAYVATQLADNPTLRSAMLAVAQYWADEADDAVHATVIFSERETPVWPHLCEWDLEEAVGPTVSAPDRCTSCGDHGWPPFDDNGDGIPAFQSCCREDSSQENAMAEAYLPYAVMRRGKDGAIETEIVGGPLRAWLDDDGTTKPSTSKQHDEQTSALFELVYAAPDDDTPRIVLADHLLGKSDPLGEYLSLALSRADVALEKDVLDRMSVLEIENITRWLGPIADVAPPERAELARGFVRTVAVHLADDAVADRVVAAPEWGTVERLWFLPQSRQRLSPKMRALRSVGPLDAAGIKELARVSGALALERLYVTPDNDEAYELLAKLELPTLRRLGIGGFPGGISTESAVRSNPFTGQMQTFPFPARRPPQGLDGPSTFARLMRAPFWARLEELVVMSVSPSIVSATLALPESERPKQLTFIGVAPTQEPAGFRLRVRGDSAIADMPSIGSETTFGAVSEMIAALPSSIRNVSFAATRWFAPTGEDLEALGRTARRGITRA
jgi:uncharacterized protein (TIGR02996 family)